MSKTHHTETALGITYIYRGQAVMPAYLVLSTAVAKAHGLHVLEGDGLRFLALNTAECSRIARGCQTVTTKWLETYNTREAATEAALARDSGAYAPQVCRYRVSTDKLAGLLLRAGKRMRDDT